MIQDAEKARNRLFRRESDWLYLRQFFIAPAFRRKGLGKLAVQELPKDVWKGERVHLEVLVSNPGGTAFGNQSASTFIV